MNLKEVFGTEKVIIGMVHFPPLPGAPLYDDKKGIAFILESTKNDLISLQEGGVDAVMFCNENDRPYVLKADYATIATMAEVIGELKSYIKIPYGVDILWDPKAALAVAKAVGGSFIREVVTGSYVSDMGLWNTNVGELYRYRKLIDAGEINILFNISAEFASPLDDRDISWVAKSVSFSSLPDAILVSGPMTGISPTTDYLKKVKNNVSGTPIFANTGVNIENVESFLSIVDGAIVGSAFKKEGNTWNPVEKNRVENFMKIVRSLR